MVIPNPKGILVGYDRGSRRQLRGGYPRRRWSMAVIIPDEILQAARMTPEEMKQEIAVLLFQKEKLTLEQASRLAAMGRLDFQHLLASRQIPLHYGLADFEGDLRTLRDMP